MPLLIKLPAPLMAPLSVSACVLGKFSAAARLMPLATVNGTVVLRLDAPVTFNAPVPSADAVPNCSVPDARLVPPVYVFVPLSVSVPAPVLLTPPAPANVPLKVSALPLAPRPNVLVSAKLLVSDSGAVLSSKPPAAVTVPVPSAPEVSSSTLPAPKVVPPL